MAREQRDRDRKRNPKDTGRRIKKKVCQFCKDQTVWVDYKDVHVLRKFMSDRGKIRTRRVSGNCVQHQSDVAVAIKTSRELALLPYAQRTLSERGGGRGGGGGGRGGPRRDGPRRDDVDAAEPTLADTAEPDVLGSLLEDAENVPAAVETNAGGDE